MTSEAKKTNKSDKNSENCFIFALSYQYLSQMFKIYITETIYHHVVDAEAQKAASAWSTPPLDAIHQTLTALRDFSKALSLPYTNHDSYNYAVNGKLMEKCIAIRNRLI